MTNLHRSNNDFYVSTIQIQANLDINEGEAFLDQFSVRKFDVFRTRESALPQLTGNNTQQQNKLLLYMYVLNGP